MINLVIDGNNLANAAYFVSGFENEEWTPDWAKDKFDSMIKRLSRDFVTDQIYIAWDNEGTQWRKDVLPDYKADRKKEGKEKLYQSIDVCQTLNYKHFKIENFEADDIIYALCKSIEGQKIIVSADKDFVHLVQRKIADRLYNPIAKNFREIPTYNEIDYRAIVGNDDNLKGLRGKGPAFAKKYFEGKATLTEDEKIVFEKHRLIMDLELNPYKDTCIKIVLTILNH